MFQFIEMEVVHCPASVLVTPVSRVWVDVQCALGLTARGRTGSTSPGKLGFWGTSE